MRDERYRPQFHYTTAKGWINDPIGLVHYRGEYHIFNDHNPFSCRFPGGKTGGEQSHWSHAVSTDLVHWKHMPIAIVPDANGACWSGSGDVDWNNTAGFQTGREPPLVLVYTSAGKTFGQSLVYSNDRGRTWQKHKGNPVLKQLAPGNRDPKVLWHEPTKKWVMVLYVRRGIAGIFNSDDLKTWVHASDFAGRGFHECPDLFALPVDGVAHRTKWVLYDAKFSYWVGRFDGTSFAQEAGPFRGDLGRNFYAAQSWNNTKGRRVQIGWMRGGKYPGMPFNQQMSFPCELTLRTSAKGIRLHRYPVKEIERLHGERLDLADRILKPGDNPLAQLSGDLFDVQMAFEPSRDAKLSIRLHGQAVTYAGRTLSCLDKSAAVSPVEGKVALRCLVDRTSLEVFANGGEVSMSFCFLPKKNDTKLEVRAEGGDVRIDSLRVWRLRSAWGAATSDGHAGPPRLPKPVR